ncbi:TPA: hypothetical protein HA251_04655 [Candidatus Woesearchaeota archaeon]|nr:hypothetical protein [Candidatus Woesearchaeota archaeon]
MNFGDLWDSVQQVFYDPGLRYTAHIAVNAAIAYANTRRTPHAKNYIFAAVVPVLAGFAELPITTDSDAGRFCESSNASLLLIEGTADAVQLGPLAVRDYLRSRETQKPSATLDAALDP